LIEHPNAAGVLVLGLGCENNNILEMKKLLGNYNGNKIKFLECQEVEDEIEEGIRLIKELIATASGYKREKVPVSKLIIGLKCGGSDGYSGITANPLVGAFSDLLIAQGGTTILTEVPEMFGAETILMNRCADRRLFEKTVDLINGFKKFYIDHGQPIYENPSPGNKKGGISTLEDKSLGCTQKSGSSLVTGVLEYGEQVQQTGLLLMGSPGNDLVASTTLAAAGAHIILFTTGRGTPFGAPVPTIKISSNSTLAEKKKDWIDFDAGRLISGVPLSELSEELYQLVLEVASGKKVKVR
jgi:altronate hydrolase